MYPEKNREAATSLVDSGERAGRGEFKRVPCVLVRAQLRQGEGKKGQDGGPTSEGLCNGLMHLRLVTARENEAPFALALIHQALNVGKQLGDPLNLVEDGPALERGQKSTRVIRCCLPNIGLFKVAIGHLWKRHPGQGGFSRLAWPEDREHGKLSCRLK